jgi:GMP synthase-like glutamine amidotransferase
LGEYFDREQVPWELVCLDEHLPVPERLDDVSALVFMGGDMSVNAPLGWIESELELARRANARGVPMMGICFGGQLISKALGGQVGESPKGREIGWHPLQPVAGSEDSPWLAGLPEEILTFHWHGETFEPPPGSTLLLENHCFHHQAYALGDHLGMQFHMEMTAQMVHAWIQAYRKQVDPSAGCIQTVAELTRDLPQRIDRLHAVADALYGNWLARVRDLHGA